MNELLTVLIDGHRAGVPDADPQGRPVLDCDAAWRTRPSAPSLGLTLAARRGGGQRLVPGLPPDNEHVLQISPRNALGWLAHLSEDCAGSRRYRRAAGILDAAQLEPDA